MNLTIIYLHICICIIFGLHLIYCICVQVQDYYVKMKFNNRNNCIFALYRMFIASFMLRSVTAKHLNKSHNYPRRQLAYMLTLAYWIKIQHITTTMIDGNMHMVNEESGEILFSALGNAVLGDNIKSDFDHMNKLYKLIPVYREVLRDIKADVNKNPDSITWHHNISVDSVEVAATSFFFSRSIREILQNTFKSYTRTQKYGTRAKEIPLMVKDFTPLVYNPGISAAVEAEFTEIEKDISRVWVNTHSDLWPAVDEQPDVDDDVKSEESDNKDEYSGDESDNARVYASWDDCLSGHFAVTQHIWEASKGICVYKIMDVYDLVDNADEAYATFSGKEWICTVPNVTIECVKNGKWNFIRSQSFTQEISNWSVLAYFSKLDRQKLPSNVVKLIMERNASSKIF